MTPGGQNAGLIGSGAPEAASNASISPMSSFSAGAVSQAACSFHVLSTARGIKSKPSSSGTQKMRRLEQQAKNRIEHKTQIRNVQVTHVEREAIGEIDSGWRGGAPA